MKGTNIYRLIDDILDILSSKFLDKKIGVIRLYPNKISKRILVDPNAIKQALLNIILNAIDAMPQGGTLQVSSFLDDNFFNISISDTGVGIAEKDLPRIFDPFYSSKDMNTGLGLSITQTIIEQHKGRIQVQSKVGEGTRFILQLPLDQPA